MVGLAKFYIDDHTNLPGDVFLNDHNNSVVNDMYIKNYGDKIRMISLGDLLCKIQNGINHENTCVLNIVFDKEQFTCPDDKDCTKCIYEKINQRCKR